MKYKSSRLLNERSGWLGLSVWDLATISYILIGANALLRPYGYELFAFPVAGVALFVLINIRLKSRPKTIRDSVRAQLERGRRWFR